jgi:hypothetical protein
MLIADWQAAVSMCRFHVAWQAIHGQFGGAARLITWHAELFSGKP